MPPSSRNLNVSPKCGQCNLAGQTVSVSQFNRDAGQSLQSSPQKTAQFMSLLQAACLAAPAFANSKNAWCHWRDWATGGESLRIEHLSRAKKERSLAAVWLICDQDDPRH